MFEIAVLGPIVTRGFGVVHECIECGGAQSSANKEVCKGFGPGCLGFRRKAQPTAAGFVDKEVHHRFKTTGR